MDIINAIIGKYGFYIIFVLTAIVYKLGFSRKLPILKSLIVYLVLAVGCIPLTVLAVQLPVIPVLLLTIVLFIIVRVRRGQSEDKGRG